MTIRLGVTNDSWRSQALRRGPAGVSALVLAETCYRLHSFTLEAAAFLATWYVLDRALALLPKARRTSA